MIKSLSFANYRGFTSLKVSPLRRINLITGANNTGKTTILEAIFLLLAHSQKIPGLPGLFRTNVHGPTHHINADDFYTFWQFVPNTSVPDSNALIVGQIDEEDSLTCLIQRNEGYVEIARHDETPFKVKPDNYFFDSSIPGGVMVVSTRLQAPIGDSDLYNRVTLQSGGEEKLLSLLKVVDPRLEKLRYVKAPGTTTPLVYAYFGKDGALSINQAGEGFNKLFALFCRMILGSAHTLLIDEIENGLYYETMPEIWRGIAAFARSEDVQVFATTHSRECIMAAHEAMESTGYYDFALHRLQWVKGKLEVVTHDQEMLDEAAKAGMEVR